jgi:glutamine synthetase
MNNSLSLNPNPLVQYLDKPALDFTKADLIRYIEDNFIEMINFRFVGGDGRLKELNFVINNKEHLDTLLSTGERVDGSNLFSHIEPGSSDLYVIPRYRTAFLNPFTETPTLDILCSYYDKDGNPLKMAPENILHRAHDILKTRTGYSFQAMGELEYYVIDTHDPLFETEDQRGYHEAEPFSKFGEFRKEAMLAIAQAGGYIKYGHSEVGNFNINNLEYAQNEIEFLPVDIEDTADQLVVAKWILRTLAYKYGITVTFAPKITVGKAGSGLHIHTQLMKNGHNIMVKDGKLTDEAKKAIAGFLQLAPSLTAFGNTNPTSYFRLVPHQEAPTTICWGDRNRSVLVRVPLGWCNKVNMVADANPHENTTFIDHSCKQTVEFRCPDGSADVHLLLAGLAVAVRHGFEMDNALEYAQRTYVDVDIFNDEDKIKVKNLANLPSSCWESAEYLLKHKDIYKQYDVFADDIIDLIVSKLKSFNDKNIRERLSYNQEELLNIVNKFFHCG